jgi:hypothetical protein
MLKKRMGVLWSLEKGFSLFLLFRNSWGDEVEAATWVVPRIWLGIIAFSFALLFWKDMGIFFTPFLPG